ncbi:MAG TPA: exo-alpha-sialidase [Candidatus Alistipes merdipullorum]|nr:exo-alpha-sialidase [Candidatus Alistipes merdipullorum]
MTGTSHAAARHEGAAQLTQQKNITICVGETSTPILLDRADNELFRIRLDTPDGGTLTSLTMTLDAESARHAAEVKLYYGGTDARNTPRERLAPTDYIPDGRLEAEPSYSQLLAYDKGARTVSFDVGKELFRGINYLWVSIRMKHNTPLTHKLSAAISTITVDGAECTFETVGRTGQPHRMAVGVRHAGDDGAAAYRIPGLVTTSRGTLLAVYDVRHNSSKDLQQHIDIGLSRSTDGGRTWERMRLPLSFADEGTLPAAQNGVGDPSILYDPTTQRAWIVAAWCHGMGYGMAWNNSAQGMDPDMTGQLVLAYSDDDGKTWSEPINITRQVKRPEWHFLLQGPGRGITMRDGTLVFPTQYIDAERMPHSAIMYSRDSGRTWHMHLGPRANTTEAQVAELPDGRLMLNMRDNRGGSRAVAVTDDLGATWSEHISSRKALREPVCMASLISVPAEQNISGRDILLFSNPDSDRARRDITIKISFDGGCTWPAENQVLLDGEDGWGYSCLTMIDPQTVGILYESSQAHITFQAIPLEDLLPR